jgi:hypothetical protein
MPQELPAPSDLLESPVVLEHRHIDDPILQDQPALPRFADRPRQRPNTQKELFCRELLSLIGSDAVSDSDRGSP